MKTRSIVPIRGRSFGGSTAVKLYTTIFSVATSDVSKKPASFMFSVEVTTYMPTQCRNLEYHKPEEDK
jgi:hypothetical protein